MPRLPCEVSKGAASEDTRRAYVPRGEGEAGGWIRIGRYDECRRRALWVRFVGFDDYATPVKCKAIEMCAGREGDDAHVKIVKRGHPFFNDLFDVLLRAADHIPARWKDYDSEEHCLRIAATPPSGEEQSK